MIMDDDIKSAVAEISSTADLLERSLKLAGLLTTLFGKRGFPLVVVGGSAVEFYTEGGYMSGDIDFCRTSLKAIPPRLMQDVIADLGGEGVSRSWRICGLYVDMLGFLESETVLPFRELETPYGTVKIIPPELALVERVLVAYHPISDEAMATARKMMAAALDDDDFRWDEARRLAELPSFDVAKEFEILLHEVNHG
jgi:hypothetical protein